MATTLAPPKSFRGITTREILSAENTDGGPPISVFGSPSVWEHQFFGEFGRVANMGAHGTAEEDVECAAYVVDNTNGTYASIQSHIVTPGASGSELAVKWSAYDTVSWSDFAKLSLVVASATKPQVSTPLIVPDAARIKKLLLKLVRRGGNSTLTPEMWNAIVTVTSGKPPTVPTGGPDDPLPEDATWGNIVFDANANSEQMKALYGDGDDVNLFTDETGLGHNLSTVATLLLPKYRTAGIAGALPCVEWAGSNVTLHTASTNPTVAYGSYTYYFVMENLDGGDEGRIWGAGFGDSFQYSIYANSSQVYAANNNLFGSPALFASDSWGMGTRHIYRWIKNDPSAAQHLFVDGVLVGTASEGPGTNNNGIAYLMDYMTGLGMTGRVGRVVAYNQAHKNATNTGAVANGLTGPEIVLRNFWGTP